MIVYQQLDVTQRVLEPVLWELNVSVCVEVHRTRTPSDSVN